ncbi:hypothetical protein BN961_04123 [Afipia felis]|uniref:Uncharacterized protein n=1 Tax=Afipia felis TaxID=1035 RepID=A0A090MTN4_AFIFE|nr:hypothetical protein BN961_04123 [Afipia felis]
MIGAVLRNEARRLRGEVEQSLDRARRCLAGTQFEHLAQQHQNGDHCRRFEIDGNGTIVSAKREWKNLRGDRGDDAVDVSDPSPHRDQGEHVEVAGQQ